MKVGEAFDLALERTTGRRNACGRKRVAGASRYVLALPDEPTSKGSREV